MVPQTTRYPEKRVIYIGPKYDPKIPGVRSLPVLPVLAASAAEARQIYRDPGAAGSWRDDRPGSRTQSNMR